MNRLGWLVTIVVFVVIACVATVIYRYAGFRSYLRVVRVIDEISNAEARQRSWDVFRGTDPRGAERGILAGMWFDRVWVWRGKGLTSYETDEYTLYSWFDGCSEAVRERLRRGEGGGVIEQVITHIRENWRKRVMAGDYVVVYTAPPEQGRRQGVVKEIYAYNFWLFLKTGIDTQCAK